MAVKHAGASLGCGHARIYVRLVLRQVREVKVEAGHNVQSARRVSRATVGMAEPIGMMGR